MTNPRDMTIEELTRGYKNSTRIVNCLHQDNIFTAVDFIDVLNKHHPYGRSHFLRAPNFGRVCLAELLSAINDAGWTEKKYGWFYNDLLDKPPQEQPAPTPPAEKTLRDEIAISVMHGLVYETGSTADDAKDKEIYFSVVASFSYGMADAMLAERNKPVSTGEV